MNVIDAIKNNNILYFDGATGTELQKRGIPNNIRPEAWNIDKPNELIDLHKQYISAGANIIKTNTFGANRIHFGKNEKYSVQEIVSAGIKNARKAIQSLGKECFIALDIGPTGLLLEPLGETPFEEAISIFAETIKAGMVEKPDLILIETMSDSLETKAAVLAAKENSNLPIFVTNTYDENCQLMNGATPEIMAAMLEGLRVDAIGINCGFGPKEIKPIVKRLHEATSLPIIVNPNAGLPKIIDEKTIFDYSPNLFANEFKEIIQLGGKILGGCCGTTPEHIEKLVNFTCNESPCAPTVYNNTIITSYNKLVSFGNTPICIGERINPTGKKQLKEALRNKNYGYLIDEACIQDELGAQVLDVNVGLPEINEMELMVNTIKQLQAVTSTPLQIDSSDPSVLEKAMRIYNGKPLINSVNGKESSMHAIFPLVAKYGGTVIALTLDENGIPNTPNERIQIAKKIIKVASSYGIQKKDIIVDPLTMAASVDENAASITLDSVKAIREQLQVCTSLGVSNISFGLANRELVNTNFLSLALSYGLNAAILNPKSDSMMKTMLEPQAISITEKWKNFTDSLTAQKEEKTYNSHEIQSFSLKDCIIRGLKHLSAEKTKELLINTDSLSIIETQIIPALNYIGEQFEKKQVFLPRLLSSAETAQNSFSVIKEHLKTNSQTTISKGDIILATVEGDIHDIGKNIVATLLENYGFNVIDLGKDVPCETVVQEAKKNSVKFIGLSALMTTTVPSMKKTIDLLRSTCDSCFIVVGGAVLTQEYADMIGADAYAKDAIQTVQLAEKYYS